MAEKLSARIRSGLATVKQWEADEDLLKECRNQIPFHLLCPDQFHHRSNIETEESPYAKDNDGAYRGDDLLLKRLTLYFKGIMTWVNNPPCELCGSTETKCRNTRGPMSPEELAGQANRVEVYWCPMCNAETTLFPRYNQPRKLLETKKGRCGEYANLFGLYCRAAGFETRYILDFTDHVWTEVYSNRLERWIMCDGCEGVIDEPAMYEKGWGKDLNSILAITTDSVVDVTRRYTRQFKSAEFQRRRMAIFPAGEVQAEFIIAQFNANLCHSERLTRKRIDELDRRMTTERAFLKCTETMFSWDGNDNDYNEGRQSGSLEWKISRGEAGDPSRQEFSKAKGSSSVTDIVRLSLADVADFSILNLRCEESTVPSSISMRLPDSIMHIKSQEIASMSDKKKAFLSFISNEGSNQNEGAPFIGFCSKQGLPVYLLKRSAYPFQKNTSDKGSEKCKWKTFHFVPDSLQSGIDNFELPLNEDFFSTLLGDTLLLNNNGKQESLPSMSKLAKSRLVAFYFGAHWCPPCRQFTPMLCEMYLHLKTAFPSHGLEIVFVSSDRDASSFQDYFSSMPWLAVSFNNEIAKKEILQRFGPLGIPAFVVVDTISGNIVVSQESSRNAIKSACERGEGAIEDMFNSWIDQIPADSKDMYEAMKASCIEDSTNQNEEMEIDVDSTRLETNKIMTLEDQRNRVVEIYNQLCGEGMVMNEAGAKAIQQVTEEVQAAKGICIEIDEAKLNPENEPVFEDTFDPTSISPEVVYVVLKYLTNIEENPFTPRFRMLRFSNQVFDQVVSSRGGLHFIVQILGFDVFSVGTDFVAVIPLAANISQMIKLTQDIVEDL